MLNNWWKLFNYSLSFLVTKLWVKISTDIYISFIRLHLDYGDFIYDIHSNAPFSSKIESVQYNATLTITGGIRGSSRKKPYLELRLEDLHCRCWMRSLYSFCKIFSIELWKYIYDLMPPIRHSFEKPNLFSFPLQDLVI